MERTIRHTTEADIGTVMAMYDHSRTLMRADGNTTQWTGYPTENDLRHDISLGVSYIIDNVGTFALVPGEDPFYGFIEHGRWIDTSTPYSTMHRLAKAPGAKGVAESAFAFAKKKCAHLRIDTHESNNPMRHLADREGFVECGTVYMANGTPRQAYEWWRWDNVSNDLKHWVESDILPQYDNFDTAHRRDHARRVMARAMMMENSSLVYVAAAMHDLGLAYGRERHHLESGRIIRSCSALQRWFTSDEIEQIAQAAEDHRASATEPPRSMLGCIVAEADRDVEPETIVRRTVEYGLSHYPELDCNGHWQRTLQHLEEKYSERGYIKLWLDNSPNAAPLSELRALISDKERLRPLFDKFYINNSQT